MNISPNYDKLIKILVLGDAYVGKTNFLLMFTENVFYENYMTTIGFDYKSKVITIRDQLLKVQIWDTAGQDRYLSITRNLYQGAHAIILMYDVTKEDSFNNILRWIQTIRQNAIAEVSIILVGNKIDSVDDIKVSKEKAMKFAKDNSLLFKEASAKDNINVSETFTELCEDVLDKGLGLDCVINNNKNNSKNYIKLRNNRDDLDGSSSTGCCSKGN